MAQKLKRSINMGFRVNEDEKHFIDKRMEAAGWTNFRSFVLHCLVRGEIVKLDLAEIREMNMLLRNISNNINQIARKANEINSIYQGDIESLRKEYNDICLMLNQFLYTLQSIGA